MLPMQERQFDLIFPGWEGKIPPATQCDIKTKKKERKQIIPRIVCLFVLFLAVLVFWSLLLLCGFLYLRRAGATLHCGVWASHFGDFPCCRAQALGMQAPVVSAWALNSCGTQA